MKKYKVKKNNSVCAKVAIECCAMLVLLYPMAHIYVFLSGTKEPFHRGFYCDDQTIKHPVYDEEIPLSIAFVIWAVIVFTLIPAIELLHITVFEHLSPAPIKRMPWLFIELYRILGYFILGALFTLLTTEMAKFKIGRLRPYFLTVCDPDFTDTKCKDEHGYNIFVEAGKYKCRGEEEAVREARKSFLSGHTSLSFYTAIFLIIYIQVRCRKMSSEYYDDSKRDSVRTCRILFSGMKIVRPFLQFGIFCLAVYITLTRISDYKHHPGDVFAGIVVGTFFALLTVIFVMDLFQQPRSFKLEETEDTNLDRIENDGEQRTDNGGAEGMRMRHQNE